MLKVAVVGAGMMGKTHCEIYNKMEGVRLEAIIDVNENEAQTAKKFNTRYYSKIEELNDGEVDIVDICLPTFLHTDSIKRASRVCSNIICEKPIALSIYEVDELKSLVEDKNLTFMVAHVLRFWNGYVKAREIVNQGILGNIESIVCYRRQKMPLWSSNNWLRSQKNSGGPTYDLIIHDLDYISWVLGKPDFVSGNIINDSYGNAVHVKSELLYKNCSATVFGSWGMPKKFNDGNLSCSLEIVGSKGVITYDCSGKLFVITDYSSEEIELEHYDPYFAELSYFVSCVKNCVKPQTSNIYTARTCLEIANAITKASEQRCVVELD